ncbi:hypothetical protein MASR1M107_09510 [Ignavibacteriales bacterium]
MKESTEALYTKEIEKLAVESGLKELFLRRASVLLSEGKPEEAILEVKEGLANFPGNPAAYYFLLKLFLEINKPKQAEITLNSAIKFFSSNELTSYYKELISEMERENEKLLKNEEELLSRYSLDEQPEEEPVFTDLVDPYPAETDEIPSEEPVEVEEQPLPDDRFYTVSDSIQGSYHTIEEEPKEPPREVEIVEVPEEIPVKPNDENDEIITAGMAIIYARQGNSVKALEIFTRLIEKEPEKKESYEKIISLLKNKISSE